MDGRIADGTFTPVTGASFASLSDSLLAETLSNYGALGALGTRDIFLDTTTILTL